MFKSFRKFLMVAAPAALLAIGATGTTRAVEITGAGSTFVAPIMYKWIKIFQRSHPNIKVDYEAIGSGAAGVPRSSGSDPRPT